MISALLVILVPETAVIFTVKLIDLVCPGAMDVPIVQIPVPLLYVPVPDQLTKVTPAGKMSRTVTPDALSCDPVELVTDKV